VEEDTMEVPGDVDDSSVEVRDVEAEELSSTNEVRGQ
jgi:hypothetical protein